MFIASITRSAVLALLACLGVALLAGEASAQHSTLESIQNGEATFTFTGIPEGTTLTGTIVITVNGVRTTHHFSVKRGDPEYVPLPPGALEDPDASYDVYTSAGVLIGQGNLSDV